jgi:hypothetical protein
VKFDKNRAQIVFDTLAREFRPVAIDKFFFSEKKKELSMCFETLVGKKACLSFEEVPRVGIPIVYINSNTFESEPYTIFIEMVAERTTDAQIEKPFNDTGIKPKSIRLNNTFYFTKKEKTLTQNYSRNEDKAFINFFTEESLH